MYLPLVQEGRGRGRVCHLYYSDIIVSATVTRCDSCVVPKIMTPWYCPVVQCYENMYCDNVRYPHKGITLIYEHTNVGYCGWK